MTLIGSAVHFKDGSTATIIGIHKNRPWFIDITNAAGSTLAVSTADVKIEGESFAQWLMHRGVPQDRDGWSMLVEACSPAAPAPRPAATSARPPTTREEVPRYGIGSIKWCGGRNNQTGKENEYGFIEAAGGDLFFHRSMVVSPWDELRPEVRVLYRHTTRRNDKKAAEEVRVLDGIEDHELVAYVRAGGDAESLPLEQRLLALFAACEDEALRTEALTRLAKTGSTETLSRLAEQMTAALTPDVQAVLLDKLDTQTLLRAEAVALRSILPCHKHLEALIELTTLTGYEAEALATIKKSDISRDREKNALAVFWKKFPPESTNAPLLPFAPKHVKM